MTLVTQPISAEPDLQADSQGARDWLDALANGTCDQAEFLKTVNALLSKTPDDGWELLSLIDQYYRRGKLTPDVFRSLTAHLQSQLMGNTRSGGMRSSAPPPQPPPVGYAAIPQPTTPRRVATPPPKFADGPTGVPAVGQLLRSRYQILGVLGQGAMGTVFEAVDQQPLDVPGDSQRVAVKVLHSIVAERPELLAELRKEFQNLQSLSHPNIVRVHEFDRDGNTAFFTMECLGGLLLSRVFAVREDAALHRPHALGMIRDVGAALAHAHSRNVVHGDLNPGNIFVTDLGEIRVLNFGASYKLHRGPWAAEFELGQRFPDTASIYASAQVLEGETADTRDDLYAFACLAYVLLTGSHPFQQYTAIKARSLRLVPERPAGLGRRQWQTLRAGLYFERDQRPSDLQDWLQKLNLRAEAIRLPSLPVLMTARTRPARGGAWMAALAALLLLAGLGWWVAQNSEALRPRAQALREQARPMLDTARNSLSETWDKARHAAGAPSAAPSADSVPSHIAAPPVLATPTLPAAAPRTPSPPAVPSAAAILRGNDGTPSTAIRSRIELAADMVDALPGEAAAHITVRRLGTWRGDVSFAWWTEAGTAKPGRDFSAVQVQTEHLADGKGSIALTVPLLATATRATDRSFYVVIDQPSPNAILGARSLTMVNLPASPE